LEHDWDVGGDLKVYNFGVRDTAYLALREILMAYLQFFLKKWTEVGNQTGRLTVPATQFPN
jgi:hypothetical protein